MSEGAEDRRQGRFVRDVMKLLTGTAVCRALGWLAWPVLLTLYAPEDFAVWGIFVAMTGIAGPLACLCYELAIVLPERDEEAANVLGLTAALALAAAVMTLMVVALVGPYLARRLSIPMPYLWAVPVCVLVVGLNQGLTYWASRCERFGLMAISQATTDAVIRVVQIGAALLGARHAGGLVLATGIGYLSMLLVLGIPTWRSHRVLFRGSIRASGMLAELRRYRKFPLVHAWGVLLIGVASALPRFMLNTFFSPVIAGYFEVAYRLVTRPANILARAVAKVFYQRASAIYARSEPLGDLTQEILRRMAALSVVPMFVLAFAASDVCQIGFQKYAQSARYVAIMYPMLVGLLIAHPLSQLFLVYERQGLLLLTNLMILVSRLAALALGGYGGSPLWTMALFSAFATCVSVAQILWACSLASVSALRCARLVGHFLLHVAPVAAILIPAKLWWAPPPHVSVILAGSVTSLYLAVVIARERVFTRVLPNQSATERNQCHC